MATQVELENLVVRMSADVENLLKGMKQTQDSIKATSREADEATKKMSGFVEGLQSITASMTGVFGTFQVLNFLKESKQEWFQAETAAFKLSSTIEANGENVQELMQRYNEFASAIQRTTTYSDEQILSLLKLAETYELTGRRAESAVEATLAFAKAGDVNEQFAFRIVQAVQKDEIEKAMQMSRRVGKFRGVKNEDEFMRLYQQSIVQGQTMLNKELETGAGRAENFKNQFSDMQEKIGEYYADVLDPIKLAKKYSVELFNSMDEEAKKTSVTIVSWTANIIAAVSAISVLRRVIPLLGLTAAGIRSVAVAMATNPITWAAAVTAGIVAVVAILQDAKREADGFNQALRSIEGNSRVFVSTLQEKTADRLRKDLPKEELERYRKDADKLVKEKEAELEDLKQKQKSIQEQFGSVAGPVPAFASPWLRRRAGQVILGVAAQGGVTDRDMERTKALIQATEKELEAATKAAGQFQMALQDLEAQAARKNDLAKMETIIEGIDDKLKDLGKTAEEVQFDKLYERGNLTADELNNLLIKLQQVKAATKSLESEKGLESFLQTTSEELEELFAKKNEDWFYNRAVEDLIRNLDAAKQPIADFARFRARQLQIEQEVADAEEKFAEPWEKFEKEERRLRAILGEGAGRWDLYDKAVDAAAKSMYEAAAAARDLAGVGTAEGLARIWEYGMASGVITEGRANAGARRNRGRDLDGLLRGEGSGISPEYVGIAEKLEAIRQAILDQRTIRVEPADLTE